MHYQWSLLALLLSPAVSTSDDLDNDIALQPSGVVAMGGEVLDASRYVEDALRPLVYGEDAGAISLIHACVTADSTLPSYQLVFREWDAPVCVYRPWRTMTWFFDVQSRAPCPCEWGAQQKILNT